MSREAHKYHLHFYHIILARNDKLFLPFTLPFRSLPSSHFSRKTHSLITIENRKEKDYTLLKLKCNLGIHTGGCKITILFR